MRKQMAKNKKNPNTPKDACGGSKPGKTNHRSTSRAMDEDTEIFITRALELKEEGNKLFQKRDNEGAMLHYDKALKLLPKDHIDVVAYLRTSMASCYMQMGLGEYTNAITECNLALEASPRYSKALLRRSRCYEALNKLDYSFGDAWIVLNMEPENVSANKVFDRVKKALVDKGVDVVELVHGDDIRWAQLQIDSSIRLVRDVISDRFPALRGFLIKYRDAEGDLVTITTTDELRLAASSHDKLCSFRLYIAEVNPNQEPTYDADKVVKRLSSVVESECFENWRFQFAQLFKNHAGFDSDSYLDHHDLGMKLYTEAMEDAVTGEDAQELFEVAADKFQEMCAVAMFNWGNVHMSKARKQVCFPEDASREAVTEAVEAAFMSTRSEYKKAAEKYEEAVKVKPDFYEAHLALGQEQFEQAKLCWYHALISKVDLESEVSQEVLKLYNKAEESMERGMQIWEEREEAVELRANMSSQINLLWGSLLYERSMVEYKLRLPTWEECLEVAVEKFVLAGASETDIAVMVKNHCSSESALGGMGFKIDEIVQAWNEMYDAKRWQRGVPSLRLEPMFRRRAPKLHNILENVFSGPG